MLIRIVKMGFYEQQIPVFLKNFNLNKEKIRRFSGNISLELYQDKNNKSVFFTYSCWDSESDLENYRHSELFKEIWTFTKPLFNTKPEAWSVTKSISVT